MLDLETGETRPLFDGARAQYLASGHVLFYHAGNFLVVPFDLDTMTTTGPNVIVLPDAIRENPSGNNGILARVSDDGTLIYLPKLPDVQLAWLDRQGNQELWPFEPANISSVRLGPDGRLAATFLEGGAYQIRILDPESGTEERFAFDGGSFFNPVWHPDGQTIAYSGLITGSFDVIAKSSGQADSRILVSTDFDEEPSSWSADGSQLIHDQFDDQGRIHVRAINAADPSESVILTSGPASDSGARVSPDGRWLAFSSNRAGRYEIYVQRFPEADQVFKVSRSGGFSVRWAEDGESLYYRYGLEIFEVRFRVDDGRFVVESESRVLELPLFSGGYDVAPDGRFVAAIPVEVASSEFRVITNWFEELERIAPTGTSR